MCESDRDVVGDALQHGRISAERGLDEVLDTVSRRLESRDPRAVAQIRVEREIELDGSRAGGDGVGHERALDPDRVVHEVLEPLVAAPLGTRHGRERVREDGGGRERHLEGNAVRHLGEERRLARRRGVHRPQTGHDLVDAELHVVVPVVAERTVLPVRTPETAS